MMIDPDLEYDSDDLPDDSDSDYEGESEHEEKVGATEEEKTIEGDFDRLVREIRQEASQDWSFDLEEKDLEFRDDLRSAAGIGRPRRKRARRNDGPILSHQVKALIGEGNQAYIDENLPEAIRIMQEVIRIEPRAIAGWTVIAQCYDDMKQEGKALQLRIMAAHLIHEPDEWERLALQSRALGLNQQARYCFRKATSLDPTNVNAFWEHASICKELGHLKAAKSDYLSILRQIPHDVTVLDELRNILIELGELQTCAKLFEAAFEHYRATFPSGVGPTSSSAIPVPGGGFTMLEILVLADLFNSIGDYENAIHVIRKGCRWLQGRSSQRYWNMCPDDREYDLPEIAGKRVVNQQELIEPGGYLLDVNGRHRLAVARIKLGDFEEGKMHADIVLSQEVYDYAPLFAEIADAYFERERWADARPIYELLGSDEVTNSMYILLQTGACLRMLEELPAAAEVYEHIKQSDPTNTDVKMKLAELYETLGEPQKALDLVYEVIAARRRTRRDPSSKNDDTGEQPTGSSSLFKEFSQLTGGTNKLSKSSSTTSSAANHHRLVELESEREKEVLRGWKKVNALWGVMLDGSDEDAFGEWMSEAETLVETFRETRKLFTSSKIFRGMYKQKKKTTTEEDEDRIASRLELDIESDRRKKKKTATTTAAANERVTIFRGVSFDDWLRLFMQYAFNLVSRGQSALADEVLRHAAVSNGFSSEAQQDTLRLGIAAIAIHNRNHPVVLEQCRKFLSAYQFNNEPLRLLSALLASGLRATDSFITSTLQKHLFREIKIADGALVNPDSVRLIGGGKRWAPAVPNRIGESVDVEDEEGDERGGGAGGGGGKGPELPTKPNPVSVAMYGQICLAAKSYQSALFYLLHAYDYCPSDPMVSLCLGIASIGRAMQRQADNRHHLIAQGLAFMTVYRKLRGREYEALSEIEYNFGRIFHQLGLLSHAAKQYEKVLTLAESQPMKSRQSGFTQEAAYNLSLIYVITGATGLAESLYRKWLYL